MPVRRHENGNYLQLTLNLFDVLDRFIVKTLFKSGHLKPTHVYYYMKDNGAFHVKDGRITVYDKVNVK